MQIVHNFHRLSPATYWKDKVLNEELFFQSFVHKIINKFSYLNIKSNDLTNRIFNV